jgi:RNA polymerase sigma factor (sigma-70 family)
MQNQSWPPFLDSLESDPKNSLEEFYRFLSRALRKVPPRPMRKLLKDDQEDMIHKVYVHCTKDDAAVLRRYVPGDRPFGAWLYTVAHHLCVDHIRREAPRKSEVSIHNNPNGGGLEDSLANPVNEERRGIAARYAQIVREIIAQLGDHCRVLLEMAADEFTPKEMVLVLRLPASENKKVSDDLRYCREKLRKRLRDKGINIDSVLTS